MRTHGERKTMEENKQKILDAFCEALQMTRHGAYIGSLRYMKCKDGEEYVEIVYATGNQTFVNVSLDSGIAMMKDIIRAVE